MARHLLSDPAVRPVVQDLVRLVLREGSVSAAQRRLVENLADDRSEGWLYPNRLHSLLSDDSSRAVNSETLEVLRRALSRLPAEVLEASTVEAGSAQHREAALQTLEGVAAEPGSDSR